MKTPTFKMLGSKCRTAPWICQEIAPRRFDRWIEPFAGRGNAFFRAATTPGLEFKSTALNDLNTSYFLEALKNYDGDYDFVCDPPITSSLVEAWEGMDRSYERELAASFMVRMGMFWPESMNGTRFGPNTTCDKNRHNRASTIKRFKSAQVLLRQFDASIYWMQWWQFLHTVKPTRNDVVYFDPPYNTNHSVGYGNIDHELLVHEANRLDSIGVRCVISGYQTDLYDSLLPSWSRSTRERASTAGGVSGDRKKPKAVEVIWHNLVHN